MQSDDFFVFKIDAKHLVKLNTLTALEGVVSLGLHDVASVVFPNVSDFEPWLYDNAHGPIQSAFNGDLTVHGGDGVVWVNDFGVGVYEVHHS